MCISNYKLTATACTLSDTENDTDQFHLGITDFATLAAVPNEGFYATNHLTCPYNFYYDNATTKCLEIFPNRINGCE